MPYELRGNCVHKKGDDKPLKCYNNHADALAYLRALEANVPEANKMMMPYTQQEVNLKLVSSVKGQACNGCRWWCTDHCHIVENYPDTIATNSICDRYEVVPPPPPPPDVAPIPVMVVEPPDMTMEMSMKAEPSVSQAINEDGLFNRIWEKVKTALNPPLTDSAFTVQKDLNGEWRWVAAFTNNFKDRDGEIISEKALDGYLERVHMGLVPMPELWVGHVKESKHGAADMVFGAGNFVVAVGHFDDNDMGQDARKYYQKHAAKTPLSHGFTFPDWGLKQGIYGVANPFEITTLPPPLIPSNPFTDFEVENMKQITPEQKAALALVFGAEKADSIVKSREQQSEEIKAAGIAFKDFAQITEDAPTTPAPDANKPMADLLTEMIADMGELLNTVTAQGKALKAFQDAQAAKEVETAKTLTNMVSITEKLAAELKLTPRAASSANETKLSEADAQAFKDQLDQTEADPFFQI